MNLYSNTEKSWFVMENEKNHNPRHTVINFRPCYTNTNEIQLQMDKGCYQVKNPT